MVNLMEIVRFELRVLRQLRTRMRTLADIEYVDLAGVLGLMIQAYESLLPPEKALRYQQLLRRRMCVPEGTHANTAIALGEIPELPELVPPLGVVSIERTDEAVVRTMAGGLRKGPVLAPLRTEPDDDA